MNKFGSTSISTFLDYGGNSNTRLRKFLQTVEKNLKNSMNISSTFNKNRFSTGFIIKICDFSDLKKNYIESGDINKDHKYYLRYFLNIFNRKQKKMYGNTYRSPKFEIEINNFEIRLKNNEPFYAYVLSPTSEDDSVIIQYILTETSNEDTETIIQQTCEGWSLMELNQINISNINDRQNPNKETQIFRSSPRELLTNYDKTTMTKTNGKTNYLSFVYTPLEKIKFLLPDYVILADEEQLPGLLFRTLNKVPDLNKEIQLIEFDNAYLKNIEIEISPTLENDILNFVEQYRNQKYKIKENKYNKIYIKERKLKCGMHNTWCFINSNGLENSVTLSLKNNILSYYGVAMIDHFFADDLCCCGFIIELDYIITIPFIEENKEEDLILPIGYSIYVPERLEDSNDFRKTHLITGPAETIYREKLWYTPQISDRIIKLNFILSKNKDPVKETFKKLEIEDAKEKLKEAQKDYIKASNLIIGNQENDEEQNIKILELENVIENLKKKIQLAEEEKEKEVEKEPKEKIKIVEVIKKVPVEREPSITDIHDEGIKDTLTDEERKELERFRAFEKNTELYENFVNLDKSLEAEKNFAKILYEKKIQSPSLINERLMVKQGILNLALNEQQMSLIEYDLKKELESENLGNLISFQFLSFKPSKMFYKQVQNIPKKIQFFLDFFYQKNLNTPVCEINLPKNNDNSPLYYFNTPLILTKENSNLGESLASGNNSNSLDSNAIKIQVKYDPSIDISIDLRDFVEYLSTKYLVVEIIDVEKRFFIGTFKIPLRELLRKGKPKIYLTKEFPIFDNEFNFRGYIQLLLQNIELSTNKNTFKYDRNLYRIVDSKNNQTQFRKKKKVCAARITDKNNINNVKNIDNNAEIENFKRIKLDKETEKKFRVIRYMDVTGAINTLNYNNNNLSINEKKLNEIKQKQLAEEKFLSTLRACEQIRSEQKREILAKVSHGMHRNCFNISLIQGQPIFFNYIIYNETNTEETYHIVIEKNNNPNTSISQEAMSDEKSSNFNSNLGGSSNIVSVITNPNEWAKIISDEKLKIPDNYNIITKDLFFTLNPNQSLPLLIKLLSYRENSKEDEYTLIVNKENDAPRFFLSIKVNNVFPIYDHIFHYYLPCSSYQKIIFVNPFKNSQIKTMQILDYLECTDINVRLSMEENKDFSFMYNTNEEGFIHEFIIFLYNDEFKHKLYLTWKFEINCEEVINLNGRLGKKNINTLYIPYMENNLSNNLNTLDNNLSLKLYTDKPEIIQFPKDYDNSFTLVLNSTAEAKYILYPKNQDQNMAMINCVNVNTRDIYKSFLINFACGDPEISDKVDVESPINNQTNLKYQFVNPIDKWVLMKFESSDENYMYVVDNVVSFNGKEKKFINIVIPEQTKRGDVESLLFISDENEEYSKTVLFKIQFK